MMIRSFLPTRATNGSKMRCVAMAMSILLVITEIVGSGGDDADKDGGGEGGGDGDGALPELAASPAFSRTYASPVTQMMMKNTKPTIGAAIEASTLPSHLMQGLPLPP